MKKLIALILSTVLILTLPISTVIAAKEDYISGSVNYSGGKGTYYYTDAYFESPASLYNPSLATMSMYAALSGSGSSSIKGTLTKIGFEDIAFNDDYFNTGIDTMGTAIAHKTINAEGMPYTLIIVGTRAGTTSTEWGGNFTIGESGNHKGFNIAAEEIIRSLNDYVEKYSDKFESNTIKIWTMGYSRSAAASNLFAAKITDDVRDDMKVDAWGDEFTLTTENIYAYTFETPVGGSTDNVSISDAETSYTNIHNIINPADLVTMVAPSEWGFVRYGVDENIIPSSDSARYNELYDEMLKYFIDFGGSEVESHIVYDENGEQQHILSTFSGKKITVNGIENTNITVENFLDGLFTELTTALGSRTNYANDVEAAARNIISYVCDNFDLDLIKAFADNFKNKLEENYNELLISALKGSDDLNNTLYSLANESSKETGFDLFSIPELNGYIKDLMPYAVNVISADVIYSQGKMLMTLLDNITATISAHYPELCIAWLECQDTNYNPNAQCTVPEYCVYEKTTTAKVGNFTMTVDGISKNITVTRGNDGFNLYSTADGKYITLSGSTIKLSDTQFSWYYNGGFYASSRSTAFSRLFSKYGKVYLSFNKDGFTASSSKKNITITETVRCSDHTLNYTSNNIETHSIACVYCKAVINSCESHCFDGDTCVCGQLSSTAAEVKNVTVSVENIKGLKFSSYKKITINVDAKYDASKIEYSLNGGNTWTTGKSFVNKKSDFLIRITDAIGETSNWSYNASNGIATRI